MDRDNELKHYGVLGMKWGIRRATGAASKGDSDRAKQRYSKTFAKASKEAAKRERKVYKTEQKAAKQREKTDKRLARPSFTDFGIAKERRMLKKAAKTANKARKAQKASVKWEKKMSKTFSEVSIKDVNRESLDAGRKYAYMLMQD